MDAKITIPNNYWDGESSLELEIPWNTPGAIYRLDELLTKDMTVLEFGAGGSTLFYSNRVKHVTSIESQKGWYKKVLDAVKGRINVELILWEAVKDIGFPIGNYN